MPRISDEQRERNRQKIVHFAKMLFAENGYNKVSIHQIVAASGMSKSNFYTYFASKQDIFLEIVKQNDYIKLNLVDSQKNATAEEQLKSYVQARISSFQDEAVKRQARYTVEFWSTAVMDNDLINLAEDRYATYFENVSKLLEPTIYKSEHQAAIDLEEVTKLVMAMIEGVAFLSSVMHVSYDDRISELITNILIQYLRGNPIDHH